MYQNLISILDQDVDDWQLITGNKDSDPEPCTFDLRNGALYELLYHEVPLLAEYGCIYCRYYSIILSLSIDQAITKAI